MTGLSIPAAPASGQLQLRLGLVFALAISVGNIIGSGIMRTPGLVADQVPVVWMVIALWALGGLHVMLSANVASELITKLPKAGGVYMAGLTAACIPVGVALHRRRERAKINSPR